MVFTGADSMIEMISMAADTTAADMDTHTVSTAAQATVTAADTATAIAGDMAAGGTSMVNANFTAAVVFMGVAGSTAAAVFAERDAESTGKLICA